MKPVINMITLGVKDLAAATAFYQQGLGFPRLEIESQGVSFFPLAGAWLSLFPWEELAKDAGVDSAGTGFRAMSLAQTVGSEEEVDAVLALAVKAGGQLVKPGQKVFWGDIQAISAIPTVIFGRSPTTRLCRLARRSSNVGEGEHEFGSTNWRWRPDFP